MGCYRGVENFIPQDLSEKVDNRYDSKNSRTRIKNILKNTWYSTHLKTHDFHSYYGFKACDTRASEKKVTLPRILPSTTTYCFYQQEKHRFFTHRMTH